MSYEPTTKERMEDARPYLLPVICGVIVLGLVGWVVWYQLAGKGGKAKTAVAATPDDAAKAAQKRALQTDMDTLEKNYQRAAEAGEPAAALDALLSRAIDRQRELMKLEAQNTTVSTERLARLETLRGDLRAKTASAESRALEKAADDDQAAGRTAAATQKMREALRLQREANRSAKSQELADMTREVRLAKIVDTATAGPLRATLAAARARGQAAMEAQDWSGALKAFEEARAAQVELNSNNPEGRMANVAALDQLDAEIESLRASDLASKITRGEQAAAAAEKAGRLAEAAAALSGAAQQQEELNAKYPKSRFASADKVTQLGIRRETALSSELTSRVNALEQEAAALLRARKTADANKKVNEAVAIVEKVAVDFPRSRGLDPVQRKKLAFLDLRRNDLESLQQQVYAAVAQIPGKEGAQMFRTEVPQSLYSRVMNINPSRNVGDNLPADSVSWNDAREFCERLSWLLGATVRLPREEEFRSAGKGALSGREWSADTTSGRSREVGLTPASPAGFQDVAGNLAEWLELARDDGVTMPVAGGSFLDGAAALKDMPVVLVDKRARARHIGFRFVIAGGH